MLRPPPRPGLPAGTGEVAGRRLDGAYLVAQALPFPDRGAGDFGGPGGFPSPPLAPFPGVPPFPPAIPLLAPPPPRCPLIIKVGRGLAAPASSRILSGRPNCR